MHINKKHSIHFVWSVARLLQKLKFTTYALTLRTSPHISQNLERRPPRETTRPLILWIFSNSASHLEIWIRTSIPGGIHLNRWHRPEIESRGNSDSDLKTGRNPSPDPDPNPHLDFWSRTVGLRSQPKADPGPRSNPNGLRSGSGSRSPKLDSGSVWDLDSVWIRSGVPSLWITTVQWCSKIQICNRTPCVRITTGRFCD